MRKSVRLTNIPKGEFFTLPGDPTVWQKKDEKAENRGGNWMYWCTNGSETKRMSCSRTVFTRHKNEADK